MCPKLTGMTNIPAELAYTAEHEWVQDLNDDSTFKVGITDHAQSELGEVVFVQLPEVGDSVTAGDVVGEIESTKSVSDLFAPVSGEIVLSLIHISEPTRPCGTSRMPSSA